MADTRCQLECEDWVRLHWMPKELGQQFFRERVRLTTGGTFDFDAVSADRKVAASISTSGANTANGKRGAGKLYKLRSDMLFLLMADVSQRMIILTERDMYDLLRREKQAGRVPDSIEFLLAPLPQDLCDRLTFARNLSSDEVSPRGSAGPDQELLRERIRQLTPPNDILVKSAQSHAPPHAWFDEDVDPFEPQQGT